MGKLKLRLFGKSQHCVSKYRYFKIGHADPGRKETWGKVYNTSYWQNAIIARKLLRFKYEELPPLHHHSKLFPGRTLIRKSWRRPAKLASCVKIAGINDTTVTGEMPNSPVKTKTERWRRYHWKDRILRDANRYEVLEVVENHRIFSTDSAGGRSSSPAVLELIKRAIHNHKWLLLAKYIEILAEESKRSPNNYYWILWNGGFLALSNLRKYCVDKVVEFALHCRCVLKCFPRRMGIEVATWLMQKGYFLRGVDVLTDWHQQWGKEVCFNRKRYLQNFKRYQVELIAELIHAVHSYVKWKSDVKILRTEKFAGSTLAVRRTGEFALNQFESALEYANKADADVTIFIQPLIELTIEFKTEFAARELFLDLVRKHERNFVLEKLYLDFIRDYFPFLEEEIEYFKQRRKLYRQNNRDDRLGLFKLRNWRNTLLQRDQKLSFKSVPVPPYTL